MKVFLVYDKSYDDWDPLLVKGFDTKKKALTFIKEKAKQYVVNYDCWENWDEEMAEEYDCTLKEAQEKIFKMRERQFFIIPFEVE